MYMICICIWVYFMWVDKQCEITCLWVFLLLNLFQSISVVKVLNVNIFCLNLQNEKLFLFGEYFCLTLLSGKIHTRIILKRFKKLSLALKSMNQTIIEKNMRQIYVLYDEVYISRSSISHFKTHLDAWFCVSGKHTKFLRLNTHSSIWVIQSTYV